MNARFWIAIGAALGLFAINYAIAGKERIVRSGTPILLELAPIDPRSLMQGDYMALRFEIADQLAAGTDTRRDGRHYTAAIRIDANRVAQADPNGKHKLRYRWRDQGPWIGTNAFFFEEGSAERYANARYGEFRLDEGTGEAVLVGLVDAP